MFFFFKKWKIFSWVYFWADLLRKDLYIKFRIEKNAFRTKIVKF